MARRDVNTVGQVYSLLQFIAFKLRDWRKVWDRMETALPAEQMRWWDARFNKGLLHSSDTVKERRRRPKDTYYGKHAPNKRAKPAAPYYEWTGSLRESTQKFTRKDMVRASIDAAKAYSGPDRSVVDSFDRDRRKPQGWHRKGLEGLADAAITDWLEDDVLEAARF
jgi:hypothetical protein